MTISVHPKTYSQTYELSASATGYTKCTAGGITSPKEEEYKNKLD
jgi:hypothetical protein